MLRKSAQCCMHHASHYSTRTGLALFFCLNTTSKSCLLQCLSQSFDFRHNGIHCISPKQQQSLKVIPSVPFSLKVFIMVSPSLDFVTQYGAQHTIFTQCSEIVPSKVPPWRSMTLTREPKPLPCRGDVAQEGDDWWAVVTVVNLSTTKLWKGCHCRRKCFAWQSGHTP